VCSSDLTVFGILKSFADLSLTATQGPQVVMAGISEALIATAVGLAVAIPAVVFFNICKVNIKTATTRLESMAGLISSKPIFQDR
jgi:biopolymer transport protein ExbB